MAVDRSKFKASSNAVVAEKEKEAERLTGRKKGSRADTLEIEEGINRFRIYPAHPDGPEDATYSEPVSRVFLPMMVVEKDKEGKEIMENGKPKMKEGFKPIFNAKLHGNAPKDLVEEYIALARKKAESLTGSEKQAFLDKINGKFSDNAAYRYPGCLYQQTSVMYADKLSKDGSVEKFGRLEVKPSVKKKMNELAALESADDPLGVDPFSDPETGLPVIINFKKPARGEKLDPNSIYGVQIDKRIDRETKRLIEFPLSDSQLEKFLEFPSLVKLFRNAFRKRDFDLQIQGLQYFDAKYDIGIFETEEFMLIAEEIESYFPEEAAEESEQELSKGIAEEDDQEEQEQEAAQSSSDEFDLMTRVELRDYNTKNRLGIVIKPTMSDDQLRELIREAKTAQDIPHIPLPGEDGEDQIPAKASSTPKAAPAAASTASGSSLKERMKKLRGQ